jgi:hypothetical protein
MPTALCFPHPARHAGGRLGWALRAWPRADYFFCLVMNETLAMLQNSMV